MKKIITPDGASCTMWKFDLKMKLTLLFILVSLFQLKANSAYSQKTRLSIDLENVTMYDAFREIESLSEFKFLYNRKDIDLNRLVSVKARKEKVTTILSDIFSGLNIEFEVFNKQIVLSKRKQATIPEIATNPEIIKIQLSVSGNVSDSDGTPLPGANILEKGTTNGAQADFDGNFSITVSDENAVLIISYIGFATKEISTNGTANLTIVLEESAAGLDEVVVVGYGTQKRSDVTGSVASVSGKQLAKQGTINATQALQGQVSGVTVVNTSGSPGAGSSILIRGQGSYGDDTDPLFVVDGAITDGIDFINPNDIQSLEVLKDASAAAIYGSRAANGVVIVTTKRGKSGKTKVSVNINSGIQTIARKLDFASSQEWRDKEVWKFQNEGEPIPENLLAENFDPSISTNWEDALFDQAFQQDYTVQFSGGGEDSNFNLSLGFVDQEGILATSKFQRVNLRMNSDFRMGKFKFGESFSIDRTKSASAVPFSFAGFPSPVVEAKDADGNYGLFSEGYGGNLAQFLRAGNPLANLELIDRGESAVNIVANVYGQLEILDGLTVKTSLSAQYTTTSENEFTPVYTVEYLSNPVASLEEIRRERYSLVWDNTLNYSKVFGDHSVDAVVGWIRQIDKTDVLELQAEGFPAGLFVADAAETILPLSGGNLTEVALESYLGRLNYSYKDKYQLTATVRQDASSRLIQELRTGVFPSFSAGWVVSNESFFPKDSFIDRLKFRGGYGELGRLNAVGAYQVQNTLTLGGNNIDYILGSGQTFTNGVTQVSFNNRDLLWERAQSSNIAMEASLFGNKVSLTAEYFVKNTLDLQFDAPIPTTIGLNNPSILVNAGDIQNKGFEVTLGYNGSIGNFNYNLSGNVYALQNEVLAFNNPDDAFVGGTYGFAGQDATRAEVGRELSNFWLLRTDGFFNSQAEVDAHSLDGVLIQPNAQPGDLRFKDINNDGRIDNEDKEFIDGSIPDFEYGFNFSGSYKNFDMSVVLQGVVGQKIFNGVGRSLQNILADQTTDYWREDNLDAAFFRPSIADPNGNSGSNDFFLEDAGYLRLRNIQIGYTLPQSLLSKLNMDSARLSLTGQNLLTITEFSGYDPENISFGLGRGVNTNVFPLAKTVLIGLTLNL